MKTAITVVSLVLLLVAVATQAVVATAGSSEGKKAGDDLLLLQKEKSIMAQVLSENQNQMPKSSSAAGDRGDEKQTPVREKLMTNNNNNNRDFSVDELQQLPEWKKGKWSATPPHPSLPTKFSPPQPEQPTPSASSGPLASTVGAPLPAPPKVNEKCVQTPTQFAFSGWLKFFMGMVPSTGDYASCTQGSVFAPAGPDYCTAQPVYGCVTPNLDVIYSPAVFVSEGMMLSHIGLGLCVTDAATCPTEDLNNMLAVYTTNVTLAPEIAVPMQDMYGYGNRSMPVPNGPLVVNSVLEPFHCTPYSFSILVASCERDVPKWYNDSGARAVAGVYFFLIFLVVLCTFLAALNSAYKGWQLRKADEDVYDADSFHLTKGGGDSYKGERMMLNVYDGSSANHQSPRREELFTKKVRKMISWFDIRSSMGDLMTVKDRNVADIDTRFFEGIRFTAMAFVIYGHTLYFPSFTVGYSNELPALKWLNSYSAIGVYPAVLAVDVFFYLSGFLFMHLYLKAVYKAHQKKLDAATDDDPEPRLLPLGPILTLKMYLHRYLRLTPLVMSVLIVATWWLDYIPTGPMASAMRNGIFFESCRKSWWHQLLYITNLGGTSHEDWSECMGWYWYLSCDMQLFIVGPIIGAAYVFAPPVFYLLVLASVAGTAAGGAYNTVFIHQMEYIKTWYRAAPYLYGFLAAVLVRNETVRRYVRRGSVRLVMYLLSVTFLISCVNVIFYIHKPDKLKDKPFQYFAHAWAFTTWGLGWMLVTIPWACGHGSFLPKLLSNKVFAILSKLTFGCYLIHPVIITAVTSSLYDIPFFSSLTYYYFFAGYLVWAFIGATCLWIVVEYPFAQINTALTR